MRLPLRLRLDWSTAGEAERSPFGWVFRGQQAGWRASLRGLGIIGTVLDWPLNGGMKVIVCLLCVCADWAQPLMTCCVVSPGHLLTAPGGRIQAELENSGWDIAFTAQ